MQGKRQHKLHERRVWLGFLTHYVKPGMIVEFGCGSGFVLDVLAVDFPDSTIVGIDKSMERLERVPTKDLNNVIPVNADITQKIFPSETVDTGIFVGVLHEVFSAYGREKVEDTLRIARQSIKNDGIIIIQDFLKPRIRQVTLTFKNEKTQDKFLRFSREFRPRKIQFRTKENSIEIDVADAVEFMSKYRSPSEEDWKEEMTETHFFFTENDFRHIAQHDGFIMKDLQKLPSSSERWVDIKQDIEFEFERDCSWIQLVFTKR